VFGDGKEQSTIKEMQTKKKAPRTLNYKPKQQLKTPNSRGITKETTVTQQGQIKQAG
jgi:hypothetical protein